MTTEIEVREAIHASSHTPRGSARVAAAERAVALADGLGVPGLQVEARLELTQAYYYAPSGPHELPAYVWLLNSLDTDVPDADQRWGILWRAKWAMTRMLETPEIPLDVLLRTHEDIRRRFRQEGFTDHAYAQHRTFLAMDTGTPEDVEHWLAVWRGAARDKMSDCRACEARSLAAVLASRGDHLAALEQVEPVLQGELTCGEEPQHSLSRAVGWFMEIGSPEAAQQAHLRGWRVVRNAVADAPMMVRHLVFLVRSGNVARAMRLLGPRVGWLEDLPSSYERMEFAAGAAMVLRAARAAGLAPEHLAGEPVPAAVDRLQALADDLAARFDRRNGTSAVSTSLARWTTSEPYPVPADFGPLTDAAAVRAAGAAARAAAAPPTAGPARRDPGDDSSAVAASDGSSQEAAPAPDLPDTLTGLEAAFRAATDSMDGARAADLAEAWGRRRDQASPQSAEDWSAVAFLERQSAHDAMNHGNLPGYRELLTRALEAAERAGNDVQRLRCLVGLAHADAIEGDVDAWKRALLHVDELEQRGEAGEAAASLLTLSRTPDPVDAAERAERAAELFARAGDPVWSAHALRTAGWALGFVEPERAMTLLQRAREKAEPLGNPRLLAACLASVAEAAAREGDHEKAAAGYREAIDVVQRGDAGQPIDLRVGLCDVLTGAMDWAALETEAARLVEAGRGDGSELAVAAGQRFLGLALASTGRALEGAEALEAALPVLRSAGDPMVAPALWGLGEALVDLGELAAAVPTFAEATEAFAAQDRVNETAHAHERAGSCAWDTDDLDTALRHYEQGAPLAADSGDLRLFVALRRHRAGVLAARDLEAGLEALRQVVPEARELQSRDHVGSQMNEDHLAAMLDRQAGMILADQGEWERACESASRAEAALLALGEEAAVVARSERGRYLAEWGRGAEAERVLREALTGLGARHLAGARVEAAAALARTLAAQGDEAGADRVWAEFGPDAD